MFAGGMKADTKKCCEIATQPSFGLGRVLGAALFDLLEGQLLVLDGGVSTGSGRCSCC
jgi:hypothetical protein